MMNKNCCKNHTKAFTLAETLITLVIVGVIAAITIPLLIAKYNEQVTVNRVKKVYSTVTQVMQRLQNDYSCVSSIADCFSSTDTYVDAGFIKKFGYYLNVVDQAHHNSDAKKTSAWLPKECYDLTGNKITYKWFGVWNSGDSVYDSFYTLNDGTVLHFEIPDNNKQSGFIFFDTNGAKKPNRIGKDQFPIGIGAYNNKKYAHKVHPFYNEDNASLNTGGLCNIRENHECNPDECTKTLCSPTAYVLKYNKLPPINW